MHETINIFLRRVYLISMLFAHALKIGIIMLFYFQTPKKITVKSNHMGSILGFLLALLPTITVVQCTYSTFCYSQRYPGKERMGLPLTVFIHTKHAGIGAVIPKMCVRENWLQEINEYIQELQALVIQLEDACCVCFRLQRCFHPINFCWVVCPILGSGSFIHPEAHRKTW